jgi:hypothetical protein
MLYRVANLSKSTDKRLASLGWGNRPRGVVGTILSAEDLMQDTYYAGLWYLLNKEQYAIGLYREEELEEVTEKQLELENSLKVLLDIFPSKSPSDILNFFATDERDDFIVEDIVPVIRKKYKKELGLDARLGRIAYLNG